MLERPREVIGCEVERDGIGERSRNLSLGGIGDKVADIVARLDWVTIEGDGRATGLGIWGEGICCCACGTGCCEIRTERSSSIPMA